MRSVGLLVALTIAGEISAMDRKPSSMELALDERGGIVARSVCVLRRTLEAIDPGGSKDNEEDRISRLRAKTIDPPASCRPGCAVTLQWPELGERAAHDLLVDTALAMPAPGYRDLQALKTVIRIKKEEGKEKASQWAAARYWDSIPQLNLFLASGIENKRSQLLRVAATRWRSLPFVRALLFDGAVPDGDDPEAKAPILCELALQNVSSDIARRLIRGGADVNRPNSRGDTPLQMAVMLGRSELVDEYIRHGAHLDEPGRCGRTAIAYAASFGNDDELRSLANHGARVNIRDGQERTPLMQACLRGRCDIVSDLILAVARQGPEDVDGASHSQVAAKNYMTLRDKGGSTAIHYAALKGFTSIVRRLIDFGAPPDLPDRRGRSALHAAVLGGQQETVELLLACGAFVNEQDRSGHTPLHLAAMQGSIEVAKVLLAHGADPTIEVPDGPKIEMSKHGTPYRLARFSDAPKALAVVALLVAHEGKQGVPLYGSDGMTCPLCRYRKVVGRFQHCYKKCGHLFCIRCVDEAKQAEFGEQCLLCQWFQDGVSIEDAPTISGDGVELGPPLTTLVSRR